MKTNRSRCSTRKSFAPYSGGFMRRVRLDLIVGILLAAAVLLFCAFAAFASTQANPPPVQQPTPAAAEMHFCPYCHRLYPGVTGRDRSEEHTSELQSLR